MGPGGTGRVLGGKKGVGIGPGGTGPSLVGGRGGGWGVGHGGGRDMAAGSTAWSRLVGGVLLVGGRGLGLALAGQGGRQKICGTGQRAGQDGLHDKAGGACQRKVEDDA